LATDKYSSQEGALGTEDVIIPCIASGTCTVNMVALLSAAAANNDLRPTVIQSNANDSAAVFGVFAETVTDGLEVKVIRRGRAKVQLTVTTVAIAVGDLLASDNGGGAKESAAGAFGAVLGRALQASTVTLDEIAIDVIGA